MHTASILATPVETATAESNQAPSTGYVTRTFRGVVPNITRPLVTLVAVPSEKRTWRAEGQKYPTREEFPGTYAVAAVTVNQTGRKFTFRGLADSVSTVTVTELPSVQLKVNSSSYCRRAPLPPREPLFLLPRLFLFGITC